MPIQILTKSTAIILGFALSACLPADDSQISADKVDTVVASDTQATIETQSSDINPVVDESFGSGGLSWREGGGLLYRFTAIERNGEIYICGAYSGDGSSISRKFSREAMRHAKVTANGDVLQRNLRYFYEASRGNLQNRLIGSTTRCNSTNEPAGSIDTDSIRVELREGRYRIRV